MHVYINIYRSLIQAIFLGVAPSIPFPMAMPAKNASQDIPCHVLGDGQTRGVGAGATGFQHSLSYEEIPTDPSNYKSVLLAIKI